MARGGFVSVEVAVGRAYKVVGSLHDARVLVTEALITGSLHARGRPKAPARRTKRHSGKLVLRYLDSGIATEEQEAEILGVVEDIPKVFWNDLSQKSWDAWDWSASRLSNRDATGETQMYADVAVSERDLNSIIRLSGARLGHQRTSVITKRERRRHLTWDDWVAAVAILAAEQKVTAGMSQTQFLDLVSNRLEDWGLEPKDNSTVRGTARAILDRWRSDPPSKPMFSNEQ